MLPIRIPERADVVNAINDGRSIYDGKCASDVKEAVDEIVDIIAPIQEIKVVQ